MTDPTFWQGPNTNLPVINANGNIFEEVQVAAGGQTVFTLATFSYTPATHSIFVYRKTVADAGVGSELLRRGVDYTETSSTTITLAAGATVNDILIFIAYAIQQIIPPIVFNGMPQGGTAGQVLTKTSGSDYAAAWVTPASAVSLLDSPRQNIAAASTVNLSAIAATTRNIQITGNTQIDGFQITNGQVWIARFSGIPLLKNNVNIVTQANEDIAITSGDSCIIRATADNVVEVIAYSRASEPIQPNYNEFRLSLTSGVAIPTADVTAANTLYCIPYKGNKISLWNGSAWVLRDTAQFSIVLAGLTATRPYDVFCFDNAGVPTLELLAWTSATVRATALVTQNGVLVKSGDATRKYLGSFYALTATTTEDSQRQRLLWNYYNRVKHSMKVTDAAGTWVYSSAVLRQADANVLNQLNYMCGVPEDSVSFLIQSLFTSSIGGAGSAVSIGVNSIVATAADVITIQGVPTGAGGYAHSQARLETYAALGFNFYSWLEANNSGAGVVTWSGGVQGGMTGHVMA